MGKPKRAHRMTWLAWSATAILTVFGFKVHEPIALAQEAPFLETIARDVLENEALTDAFLERAEGREAESRLLELLREPRFQALSPEARDALLSAQKLQALSESGAVTLLAPDTGLPWRGPAGAEPQPGDPNFTFVGPQKVPDVLVTDPARYQSALAAAKNLTGKVGLVVLGRSDAPEQVMRRLGTHVERVLIVHDLPSNARTFEVVFGRVPSASELSQLHAARNELRGLAHHGAVVLDLSGNAHPAEAMTKALAEARPSDAVVLIGEQRGGALRLHAGQLPVSDLKTPGTLLVAGCNTANHVAPEVMPVIGAGRLLRLSEAVDWASSVMAWSMDSAFTPPELRLPDADTVRGLVRHTLTSKAMGAAVTATGFIAFVSVTGELQNPLHPLHRPAPHPL